MRRSDYEKLKAAHKQAEEAYRKASPSQQRECWHNHEQGITWGYDSGCDHYGKPDRPPKVWLKVAPAGYGSGTVDMMDPAFTRRIDEVRAQLQRWMANEGDWPVATPCKDRCG